MTIIKSEMYVEVLTSLGKQDWDEEFNPSLCEHSTFVIKKREDAEQVVREKALYGDEGKIKCRDLHDLGDGGPPVWWEDDTFEPEEVFVD